MVIKCNKCGHKEQTSTQFFVKLIGGALPVGGFWAWVAYFFAGTGLALPICIAMVSGGVAILVFKDEIVKFIISSGYVCSECNSSEWVAEG